MSDEFTRRLHALESGCSSQQLRAGLKGIEKESLRITPQGALSTRPHPVGLGSTLTHRWITTDFSEAQLELVTPPCEGIDEVVDFLESTHQFTFQHLGDECLWAASMPCAVGDADEIPLARFGKSNPGRMKETYRRGLSHRYGSIMQIISGVHYNYSLPQSVWPVLQAACGSDASLQAFRSDAYLNLLRNFRRAGWLVLYLFGSSPAICKSFLRGSKLDLPAFDRGTLHKPWATSLRMSDLGYRNSNQKDVHISLNTIEDYIAGLKAAINTPHPDYEKIGVLVDGEYRQLNSNVLQIENEYYSFMRPKRVARSGEPPTEALTRGGIEYVELRALDLDPFAAAGVCKQALRFLEAMLVTCLIKPAPPIDEAENAAIRSNQQATAEEGRRPGLQLQAAGETQPLAQMALGILDDVEGVCELFDRDDTERPYARALQQQRERILQPDLTPSARILAQMKRDDLPFFPWALEMSAAHKRDFEQRPPLSNKLQTQFSLEAVDSILRKEEIEAQDDCDFATYLRRYFARAQG